MEEYDPFDAKIEWDRLAELNPKDYKIVENSKPTNQYHVFMINHLNKLIQGKILMMDEESCVIWKADAVVAYKDKILIVYTR